MRRMIVRALAKKQPKTTGIVLGRRIESDTLPPLEAFYLLFDFFASAEPRVGEFFFNFLEKKNGDCRPQKRQ